MPSHLDFSKYATPSPVVPLYFLHILVLFAVYQLCCPQNESYFKVDSA